MGVGRGGRKTRLETVPPIVDVGAARAYRLQKTVADVGVEGDGDRGVFPRLGKSIDCNIATSASGAARGRRAKPRDVDQGLGRGCLRR